MKKILTLILLLLVPSIAFGAIATGWQATSTTQGWIFPSRISGIDQSILGMRFFASTTKASVFPSASTTALTVNGVASTSVLRIDSLANGCLNILSGLVGTQTCNISNSKWGTTTGSTITPNGGGGIYVDASSTITSLFMQQATSTSATSTDSFFSALGRFTRAVIPKLSNLVGNGFVKTSGGDGSLSIDTNTYLTAAIQNLGPANQLQNGTTITISTSTSAFNGLTASTTITGSGGNTLTFTNSLAGTLGVAGGGTGATSFTGGQLLYGGGTNPVNTVATGTVSAGAGISLDSATRSVVGGSLQISNSGVISVGNGTGITCSGTNPATCSLAAIGANSILANNTSGSAIPVSLATSSFFSLTQPTTINYPSTTALSVSGALMVNAASSSINNLNVLFASSTALSVGGALMVNNASSSINNLRLVNGSSTAFDVSGMLNVNNGTSTITNLTMVSATTTTLAITSSTTIANAQIKNASTTALTVSGVASTSVLRIDTLTDGCLNITTGLIGSTACGGGGGNSKWATSSTFITQNAATRVGISSSTPSAIFGINPIAGNALNQFVVGSSSATSFIIKNDGTIGVGTTSPSSVFSIHGKTDKNALEAFGGTGSGPTLPGGAFKFYGGTGGADTTDGGGGGIGGGMFITLGTGGTDSSLGSDFPAGNGGNFILTGGTGGAGSGGSANGAGGLVQLQSGVDGDGVTYSSQLNLNPFGGRVLIGTLTDGCLNIASGYVGSQSCGGGGNSKWASSTNSITPNGGLTTRVGSASTTPFSNIGIGAAAGETPFAIGSSTRSVFIVDKEGQVAIGTSTAATTTLLVEGGGDQLDVVNYPIVSLMNRVAGIGAPAILGSYEYNQGSAPTYYPIVELRASHQNNEQADWCVLTRAGSMPSVQQKGLCVRSGNATNYVGIASTTPGATLGVTGKNTTTGVMALFGDSANTTRFYMLNNGKTGFGSTTPFAYVSINPPVASPGTAGAVSFAVGSSTATAFAVQSNGDIVFGGGVTVPTLASCGTSPSLYSGNDNAGVISTGGVTAITACTLTYSHPVDAINRSCIAEMATTTGITLSASTTATTLVISASAAFQGKRVNYHCINTALNI